MNKKRTTPETRKRGLLRGRLALAACLLLVGAPIASAFHVRMELQPEAMRMGESAELAIIIQSSDTPGEPALPDIPGLRIGRPSTEHSFSMTIVNGSRQEQRFTTYRYRIIPLQPGEYTIGPLSYTHENQTVEVPAKTLRVVAPGDESGRGGQVRELSDLVFATLEVDKEQIYVQESFTLTITIYSRDVNLGRDVSLVNMPDSGIATQPFQELRTTREVVRNEVYDVRRYQTQIRPLTAGTIRFDPELHIQILVPRNDRRGRGLFDDPFFQGVFSNMEAHPFELELAPAEVLVRALPDANRPDSFSGGVGAFDFNVRVDPLEVRPGDPITLSMMIQGEGNMDTVSPPSVQESDLFRVYPPRLTNKDLDRSQSRGRKLYEQVIIPRTDKAGEVPPLHFTYFDPRTEEYKSIARGPFALTIQEGDPSISRVVRADDASMDHQTRIVGQDIVYLKPAPKRWWAIHNGPWYSRPVFLGLQAVPPALVLAVFLFTRRLRAMDADMARTRRYRAPRSARPGLRRAEKAIRREADDEFFDGLWAALTAYFGDRLNLPPGSVSAHEVMAAMQADGLDEEQLAAIHRLFDACEQRRFAGVKMDTSRMQMLLIEFRRLLKACEKVKA